MMKVLFVDAADPISEFQNRYRPIWPAYLAAYTEKYLDGDQFEFRFMAGTFEDEIASFSPDVVAIGAVSETYRHAEEIARKCKDMDIPVIVGGYHISLLPGTLSKYMDVGVIGEGEQTFLELMRLYVDRNEFSTDRLNGINGVVFRQNDRIVKTPNRDLIQNLDDIPHPKRSLIGYGPDSYLFTSRGCPYNCVFCASTRFWTKFRYASPEYVVDEIEELVENGSAMIRVNDDLFGTNRRRLSKIADIMTERGLQKRVRLGCSCRANLVTTELVDILKRINVVSVTMGLESGSQKTLSYLKSNVTIEDNWRAVNLLKNAGIQANGLFVIGSPNETEEDMMETYKFISNSRLDFVDIAVLMPLPGTPVWEYAMEKGIVSEHMDWDQINMNFQYNYNKAIIVSQVLSRDELVRLYRKFRRLRFYKILKALPRSPWLPQVPIVVLRVVSEIIARWGRKLLTEKSSVQTH